MRILELLYHLDVLELEVEVLIDRLKRPPELDVVLELDGDLVIDQRFEEAGFGVAVSLGLDRALYR